MAALTSSGRSCWVQCPQPGSSTGSRSCGHDPRDLADALAGAEEADHQVLLPRQVQRGHQ